VTDALFEEPEGATPLDEEDRRGLLRTDIAFRHELNRAEAENIASANLWVFGARRRQASWLLEQRRLKELHRQMYGEVWGWAGAYRRRETNIRVVPFQITSDLENLLLDVRAQTADLNGQWSSDEIAVRFHHRLVWIHPFPNGNGRHARLAADALVAALGRPRFTWGSAGDLTDAGPVRSRYLNALRVADREFDYRPLLDFARSS
jgi:Fic-DOC domain mobile mystery protein B